MSKQQYLVAVDGSEWSTRAAECAVKLAAKTGATVKFATVIPWSGYTPMSVEEVHMRPLEKADEEKTARDEILAPLEAMAAEQNVTCDTYLDWGHPVKKLHKLIKDEHINMLFAGRRGRSRLADLVLGSVANSLAHHEGVPIVLVP